MSAKGQQKRRRIAGESKPGKPAASLPKAPVRTDPPKPPKPVKLTALSGGAWLLIGLTVAALAFGVSGIVAAIVHWQREDAGTIREEASDAAAVAAETIFTYSYNQLDKHESDSAELMTPKFAKKFRSISPALNALAPQRHIQVKGVARHAATIECGDACVENKARVLVFIDQARVADGASKPTVFGNRIEMFMVKRNGEWLVDDIKAL